MAGKKTRSLVVAQLSGGNDYLNCVIPYNDPLYTDNRRNVGTSSRWNGPLFWGVTQRKRKA